MADLSAQLVRGKQAAFQYKPIVSEDLSWLARTENERNYLESERKRKEQEDLRDKLLNIQQLGLPKEMQGYLNSQVDDVIAKVRAGEIDPLKNDYELRSAIAGIAGEANQLTTINENLKTLAKEDKQVILGDEDVSTDYKNQYFDGYKTAHEPGTDVIGKYVGIQSVLQGGTEGLDFDETAANSIVNDWISRNENKIAEISKLKQQGFSGYNLISKLSQIPGVDISELEGYLNTKSDVYLRSEYARDKKAAQSAGIPIESYEDYKADRLRVFIPKQERITEQKIEADPFAKEQFKESLKGKTNLSSVFESPVSYTIPEYGMDAPPTETLSTNLNLNKEVIMDYTDPESKEKLRGQEIKVNRLHYDPATQQYIVEGYRYIESKEPAPQGVPIVNLQGKKGNYYLDTENPIYIRANEDDINMDALISGIADQTKAKAGDVKQRVLGLKQAADQTKTETPQRVTAGGITVDTKGTVKMNKVDYTFEEVVQLAQGDMVKAVQFWENRGGGKSSTPVVTNPFETK